MAGNYEIEVTDDEIDELWDECDDAVSSGKSNFPDRSYEAGVKAAIAWLLGETNKNPLDG